MYHFLATLYSRMLLTSPCIIPSAVAAEYRYTRAQTEWNISAQELQNDCPHICRRQDIPPAPLQ